MRRLTLVLLLVAVLAGCSDDDDAGPTTSVATPAGEIALRGDGLGVVDLGAAPEGAIDAVTDGLGEPTRDTGWGDPFSPYGTCPGDRVRGVEWGGLTLLFADGETEQGSGEHLFAWRVVGAPPAISTVKGLGFGATATDAAELYPDEVEVVPADDPFPAFLEVEAEGGRITAYLDDADTITNLEAGTPCGE